MESQGIIDNLLDAKDVKKILRCSLQLVYLLADRRQLPCVRWQSPSKVGKQKTVVRFRKEDVLKFITDNYRTAAR